MLLFVGVVSATLPGGLQGQGLERSGVEEGYVDAVRATATTRPSCCLLMGISSIAILATELPGLWENGKLLFLRSQWALWITSFSRVPGAGQPSDDGFDHPACLAPEPRVPPTASGPPGGGRRRRSNSGRKGSGPPSTTRQCSGWFPK